MHLYSDGENTSWPSVVMNSTNHRDKVFFFLKIMSVQNINGYFPSVFPARHDNTVCGIHVVLGSTSDLEMMKLEGKMQHVHRLFAKPTFYRDSICGSLGVL